MFTAAFFLTMELLHLVTGQVYCPVMDIPECSCRSMFHRYFYIKCEGYVGMDIPLFEFSNVTQAKLSFNHGSRIQRIRSNAFVKIQVQALYLQNLGIQTVESGAFFGQNQYLREIHLDANEIAELPGMSVAL